MARAHIEKPAGKEYFDAAVRIERISSITVRMNTRHPLEAACRLTMRDLPV